MFLSLLLAAQTPKFRFQFSYARFSGETSCPLFLCPVSFLFVTQHPATDNRIPEAQVPVRPPQVQVQNATMRPHTPIVLRTISSLRYSPSTRTSPTSGSP